MLNRNGTYPMTSRAAVLNVFDLPDRTDFEVDRFPYDDDTQGIVISRQGDPAKCMSKRVATCLANEIRDFDAGLADQIDAEIEAARNNKSFV